MKTYRFYKDETGWFIDLKWFPFNASMDSSSEELLDKLSNNGTEVYLWISTKPQRPLYNCLHRVKKFSAIYTPDASIELRKPNQLWLGIITLLVFGYYPEKIYFAVKK